MVNRLEEQSSLSRLRDALGEVETDRLPDQHPGWESDLREVRRRLARLRSEFPALAEAAELNTELVKAGESLSRSRPDNPALERRAR